MPIQPSTLNNPTQPDQEAQGRREQGSGFTNISRILGANAGAGQQMGQQIGGAIANQAGKVQQGVDQSSNAFNTQYGTARDAALSKISQIGQLGSQVNSAGQINNPNSGNSLSSLSDDDAKNLGQEFNTTGYKGPSELGGAKQLTGQAGALQDIGKSALGGGDQRSLLQTMVAKPGQYSRGQSTLDNTLIGQSNAAQQAIRNGGQQALQTGQSTLGSIAGVAQKVNNATSTINQQKSDVGSQLASGVQNIQGAANTQANNYYAQGQILKNALSKLSTGNALTEEERGALGTAKQYGIDTNMTIDPRYANLSQGVLGQIAALGNTASTGGKYYTPDQIAAQKNLQLLGQQDVTTPTAFNTNLFNADSKMIPTLSNYQAIGEQHQAALDQIPADMVAALNRQYAVNPEKGAPPTGPSGGDINFWRNVANTTQFTNPGVRPDVVQNAQNSFAREAQDVENEQLAQRGTSLQNYINMLANPATGATNAGETGLVDKFGHPIG